MKTLTRGFDRGDSLIEVLIALALSAVTAFGIIGAQMWLARNERSMVMRETAVSIADSVVEGIRRDLDRDPVMAQWRTRAAAVLPEGGIDLLDRGNGVHVAVVKWRSPTSGNGDDPSCAEPGVGTKLACVTVAFAR